ncbi:MAG TPA: pitrilysin family protein, partial [Allosphingosinicella sp.]|nr:pitrilysin family protein [Allosphingosinicella sp.]
MIRRLFAPLAAASLLLAPAAAPAQDFPKTMPAAGTPKPFTVPASETYTLANGMQVTLIPYGQIPKATVSLRVYAGGLNEGDDRWLSTLAAQMLREGAAGRSGSDIAEAAAGMGGGLGIGAGPHETSLNLSVLSEHADNAVRLIADVARRPDFPESEFGRVRDSLVRNLAVAKSQPQSAADAALAAAYYGPGHPYGSPLPAESKLKGYSLDAVRAFHRENFGARRARLYVAGRFDSATVKEAINAAFGDWTGGPERLRLPPQPRPGPRLILVDRPDAAQSTMRIAFPAPVAGDPSDLRFRVTNALLGGAFNSRITTNIREKRGYTYSPGSGVTWNPGEAMWTFNADVTTAVTGPALQEVIGEIRRLQTEAPTQTEAAGMRTYMAGIFVLQNASPPGLINSIATRDFHGLPANWLESYIPGVLAVDAASMQSIARQTLPLERMTIVVVGDLAKVEPQLKAVPELRDMKFERVKP